MKAALLTDVDYGLEIAEVPEPQPGDGEVVIEVTACGICGSDLTLGHGIAPAGTVLGHEIAGRIHRGDADGRWTAGTDVTVRPFFGCGQCRHCRRGRQDHCAEFAMAGFRRPGGFAELVAVRSDEVFALPVRVTGPDRALVEPLAIVRHAMRRVDLTPADTLAITGAGPIGIAAVIWARAMGVEHIVVSEPDTSRQELARRFGASAAVAPADLAGVVAGDAAPSVVLECSGRPGLIGDAMVIGDVEARIGVVGMCTSQDHFMPLPGLVKEVDIRFCMFYEQRDFVDTLDALDRGLLDIDGFVTETVDFSSLPDRFAALGANPNGGKIVLQP